MGAIYITLLLSFAFFTRSRFRILEGLKEPLRSAGSAALSLYFGAWLAFAAYLALGMNARAFHLATLALLALNIVYGRIWMREKRKEEFPRFSWPLLSFVALFTISFILGISFGENGTVFFRFNFIDTSIHMSVARAFLEHPHFPPKDLVMAGYPLKYHFMADFLAAFLSIGGLELLRALYALNIFQAVIAAIALWGIVDRLSPGQRPLVTTAVCSAFAFIMPLFSNLIHYILFRPPYFPTEPAWMPLVYPYFNFEYILMNLLQPQRALLFSLPVILLIIHAIAKLWKDYEPRLMKETAWLLALMPFAHITSFLMLSAYFTIIIAKHRKLWPKDIRHFPLPACVALLQVLYNQLYGPAFTPGFSGWDAGAHIPLQEFQALPALFRLPMFWMLVNGEFFALGAIGLFLAWRAFQRRETETFLEEPIPYFLCISLFFFLLINVYHFSRNWGDSNKFVLFLNFWLILIFGQQLNALVLKGNLPGKILLPLILAFSVCPFAGDLYLSIYRGTLFSETDVLAADWMRRNTGPDDVFVTTPLDPIHFVSALGGRAVVHGMDAFGLPYYESEVELGIRALYERGNLDVLKKHPARYIVVSSRERTQYRVHPVFDRPKGLVYAATIPGFPEGYPGPRIYDAGELSSDHLGESR